MSETDLIADTNRLLQRIVEIDAERKEAAEKDRLELDAMMKKTEQESQERMQSKLAEFGVPDEGLDMTVDWDKRQREAQAKAQESMEQMKIRDQEYKDKLLAELSLQSDLLKRIAEKLGV